MPDGNGAAVGIDVLRIIGKAKVTQDTERLRREGFIRLNEIIDRNRPFMLLLGAAASNRCFIECDGSEAFFRILGHALYSTRDSAGSRPSVHVRQALRSLQARWLTEQARVIHPDCKKGSTCVS